MSIEKQRIPVNYSNRDQVFQQEFLSYLKAIEDPAKRKAATQYLKDLVKSYAESQAKIYLVLSFISSLSQNFQKSFPKNEVFQSLAIIIEVLQGKLLNFTPQIFQIALDSLLEDDLDLHETIRDLFGKVSKYVLSTVDAKEGAKAAKYILKSLWGRWKGASKCTQIGTALCISKIIQTSKRETLRDLVERIASKIYRTLRKPEFRAKFELLECSMSLIVFVEDNSEQLKSIVDVLLPVVVENISSRDLRVKNIALKIVNKLAVSAEEVVAPHKVFLIETVSQYKYDKAKDIQDIANSTICVLKNIRNVPQEKSLDARKSKGRTHSRSAQKERPSGKDKYENNNQDFSGTRPSILKDSSYESSPGFRFEQRSAPHFLTETMGQKVTLGPFTTKSQRNMQSGSSFINFSSPNGALESQSFDYPVKEVSNFDSKYSGLRHAKRPEYLYTKEGEERSNTPSISGGKNTVTPPDRSPKIFGKDSYQQQKAEMSSNEASTRILTADGDGGSSKKSNLSSPMPVELSKENFSDILSQLNSINQKQSILMQGVSNLRNSTKDNLDALTARINQIEGVVGKLCLQQKDPNLSTRTSAIFSEYPLKMSQAQFYGRPTENSIENGREIERSMIYTSKAYQEQPLEQSRKRGLRDTIQESSRMIDKIKEGGTRKFEETKAQRSLLWMRIEELLHKKAYTDCYKLCLDEGDEDILICLMKETGPVIEKLKGNLGEILLNRLKSKLFDHDIRPILLDWIERALFVRTNIARGTVIALHGILGQILEYHRGPYDKEKEKTQKVFEYLGVLLETMENPEENRKEKR